MKGKCVDGIHPGKERHWPLTPLITVRHSLFQTGSSPQPHWKDVSVVQVRVLAKVSISPRWSECKRVPNKCNPLVTLLKITTVRLRHCVLLGNEPRRLSLRCRLSQHTYIYCFLHYWLMLAITTGVEFQRSIQTKCRWTLLHVHQRSHALSCFFLIWFKPSHVSPLSPAFHSFPRRGSLRAGHAPLYHADVSGGLLKEKPSARNAKTNAPRPASAASYV